MKLEWDKTPRVIKYVQAKVGEILGTVEYCGSYTASISFGNVYGDSSETAADYCYHFRVFETGIKTEDLAIAWVEERIGDISERVFPIVRVLAEMDKRITAGK